MENNKIILTTDFWGKTIIPAILTKVDGILPNRCDVWLPSGYTNSGGGYSTRAHNDIFEFTESENIKTDVLEKWNTELEKRRQYELERAAVKNCN
jgi:hypothetical protein